MILYVVLPLYNEQHIWYQYLHSSLTLSPHYLLLPSTMFFRSVLRGYVKPSLRALLTGNAPQQCRWLSWQQKAM